MFPKAFGTSSSLRKLFIWVLAAFGTFGDYANRYLSPQKHFEWNLRTPVAFIKTVLILKVFKKKFLNIQGTR
jgi:hypothetical protein